MIQRIQTIYFFIALILVAIPLFGLTFFECNSNGTILTIDAYKLENSATKEISSHWFYVFHYALVLLLVWVIFSYKNRNRQHTLAWFAFALNLAVGGWMFYYAIDKAMQHNCSPEFPTPGIGFYLYQSAFIFILLGIGGVRKDRKLIASLNRIR